MKMKSARAGCDPPRDDSARHGSAVQLAVSTGSPRHLRTALRSWAGVQHSLHLLADGGCEHCEATVTPAWRVRDRRSESGSL